MLLFLDIPPAVFISFVFAKTEVQEHKSEESFIIQNTSRKGTKKVKKNGLKDISALIVGSLGSHLSIWVCSMGMSGCEGYWSYCFPQALLY